MTRRISFLRTLGWVCIASFPALTLQAQIAPTITTQPASQTILIGSNAFFNVAVDGTGPFKFQWQRDGTNLPNDIITTVAGNGGTGFSGDGAPATNTTIQPFRVVVADSGEVYVVDTQNNRIRKIDTNGILTTVAGVGPSPPNLGTFGGDGGQATNANFYHPTDVTFDKAGNLYIADSENFRVRRVDSDGIITTVAGNGGYGFSGDGGPATNATVFQPFGLAFDAGGNLYISDEYNNRIRKVDTNGIISTVAGIGPSWPSSGSYSGDGGAATNASLNGSQGLVVDASGTLFFADSGNNRVRTVDTNGIINTFAGNGNSSYSGDGGPATNANVYAPYGVTFDVAGNLYIADDGNNRVRKVDTNGIISTVAGKGTGAFSGDGGAATNASLWAPTSLSFDTLGNLFIADNQNNRIREVHFGGISSLTIPSISTNNAGNYVVIVISPYGSATSQVAVLTVVLPPSIIVQPMSQGVLAGSNATLTVTANGTLPLYYSWFLSGTNLVQFGTNASLNLSNISAANLGNYQVVISNIYGSATSSVATLAFPPSIIIQPVDQSALLGSNAIFSVSATGVGPLTFQWQLNGTNLPNNLITTVAGNGISTFSGDNGFATNAAVRSPHGTARDKWGNLFIADSSNNRVRKVDTNGIITTVAGTNSSGFGGDGGPAVFARLLSPTSVAVDDAGNLFIADTGNSRIRIVSPAGIITTFAGTNSPGLSQDGVPALNAKLNSPWGVVLDGRGNVYFSDNHRIRMINSNGIVTTVAGTNTAGFLGDGGPATNASLDLPTGFALDSAGNLFISDSFNNRIRKVDTNGVITSLAGKGPAIGGGYSGDGGAATNATLSGPMGECVDAQGNLYFADNQNRRVRRIGTNGIITTIVGNSSSPTNPGDGGAPTNATLVGPYGVMLDESGNLYIADNGSRIRKVFLYAGNPFLLLSHLRVSDAGAYTVVVTSPFGSTTGAVANLTVLLPPSILNQPTNTTAGLGSNATFSVTASGTMPLEYQWQINGTNFPGQTNATLNLINVQWSDAVAYRVVVANNFGVITSSVATLTVGTPPSITSYPADQMVASGTNLALSITAAGDGPLTYQWRLNGTNLPPPMITVAGSGTPGFSGDGGYATNANLWAPSGVAVDGQGNLYISDNANNRVRKVNTNGVISTIAGTGVAGLTGNGGQATNALLRSPQGLTVDVYGNLFLAEGNSDVRKIDTNGIITRVAGTTSVGYSFDGAQATNTTLGQTTAVAVSPNSVFYLTDYFNWRIRKVDTNGIMTTAAGITAVGTRGGFSGDGGIATNANLGQPTGVALDSLGDIVISDTDNGRIRFVGTNGIITTVAGGGTNSVLDGISGTNALLSPINVAVDPWNNIFISCDNRVRKLDVNGLITTIAGGGGAKAGEYGPATGVSINAQAVAVDSQNNLFIADRSYSRIRKVCLSGLPTLYLPNPGTNNAGIYSVVVSSPFGSITSGDFTITVLANPTLRPLMNADGSVTLNISSTPTVSSRVYSATNLTPPIDWQPIYTNFNGGDWQMTDTNAIGEPRRFYRVSTP